MHLNKYQSMPVLEASASLGAHVSQLLTDFFLQQLAILAPAEVVEAMKPIAEKARAVVEQLQKVPTVLNSALRDIGHVEPIPRPLLASTAESKSKFVVFSITQLITELLQKNAVARKMIIEASEYWKTGKLHGIVPPVLHDMTCARKFRDSWLTKKAEPGEERVIRIGCFDWLDKFTVS